MKARKRQIIKLSLMISLTFTFFLTEVICGHITGSLALIGDSYHMISDVLALIIGLSCVVISTKSSKQNTFGWARSEILGALFNAIFLSTLCFTIFIEAMERLIHPHHIHEPNMLLVVGCLGLAVNLLGILMFCNEAHGHGHSHETRSPVVNGNPPCPSKVVDKPKESLGNGTYSILTTVSEAEGKIEDKVIMYGDKMVMSGDKMVMSGDKMVMSGDKVDMDEVGSKSLDCMELNPDLLKQRTNHVSPSEGIKIAPGKDKKRKIQTAGQMNIRGVFLHILGDALGSVVVIISALIIKYCEGDWTLRIDPILSLVMICIILTTTFPLLKQSSLILLQHAPNHIVPSELIDRLSTEIPGLMGIHELHVWQLVGSRNVVSMHVKCADSEVYEEAAEKIRGFLHEEGIHSSTIQPEFVKNSNGTDIGECLMECQLDESCLEDKCCNKIRKRMLNNNV